MSPEWASRLHQQPIIKLRKKEIVTQWRALKQQLNAASQAMLQADQDSQGLITARTWPLR
jgi:hypothetical protein